MSTALRNRIAALERQQGHADTIGAVWREPVSRDRIAELASRYPNARAVYVACLGGVRDAASANPGADARSAERGRVYPPELLTHLPKGT